jgi:hypothetical protein
VGGVGGTHRQRSKPEDPSPPKRKPKVERPVLEELQELRETATLFELPAILLMEGVGLRSAEVQGCRWQDVDLVNGVCSFSARG